MSPNQFIIACNTEQDKEIINNIGSSNPTYSFYKYNYNKHTNFSISTQELLFEDFVDWGKKIHCPISRKGDLLSKMYFQIKLPPLSNGNYNENARWVPNVGHVLLEKVDFEIGGVNFDSQTGEYLYVHNQLSSPYSKKTGLDYMIGYEIDPTEEKIIYVPLAFWFNKHHSLSLPLCSLPMQEIKIKVQLKQFDDLVIGADTKIPIDISILADFIILHPNERKLIQNKKHNLLIEQVQTNMSNTTTNLYTSIELLLRNPVKEIIWMVQRSDVITENEKVWFDFSYKNNKNPIKHAKIKINGEDLNTNLPGEYYNLIQPWQFHSNIPENTGICVFSFALFPEHFQPSGHANFSKLDNATLDLELYPDYFENPLNEFVNANIKVYAIAYNNFIIENGTAKLLYS